jgi:hypothetical protein
MNSMHKQKNIYNNNKKFHQLNIILHSCTIDQSIKK